MLWFRSARNASATRSTISCECLTQVFFLTTKPLKYALCTRRQEKTVASLRVPYLLPLKNTVERNVPSARLW